MNIGALTATMGVDTTGLMKAQRDMDRWANHAQSSVDRVNTKLRMTGAAMKKVGKSASLYLTAPLSLAGSASFKMYKDFEYSLSKIVGLVGVSQDQVNAWKDDIIKMGPELGKSPKELADALFFITSAGIKGAEAMDTLRMSAKASAVGLGETKVVADLVTSAMNAYGSANESASHATDVLTATVREGKVEADALASSMGMVLPIASNMGVRFDEVGAAIAGMTRTGTPAATASMELRQILASLLKPARQSEQALSEMGMSFKDVNEGFKEAGTSSEELRKMLATKGLLATLLKLRELTKGNAAAMAKIFPNIRALSGVNDILGANLESNAIIFKHLTDVIGDTNKAFEVTRQTVQFKWTQAIAGGKAALTVLGEELSKTIVPLLEKFTVWVTKLTEWFKNLNSVQKKWIIILGGVLAALGPVLTILGTFIGTIIPALITGGLKIIGVIKLITTAIAANPWGTLALALAGVIGYFVLLNRKMSETQRIQKTLNDFNKIAIKNTMKQRIEIEQLYRVAQNEKNTLQQRRAAIDKLNKISPEYFGNLDTDIIKTDKARIAKEKYIEQLLKEARVKAATAKLVELGEQELKNTLALEQANKDLIKARRIAEGAQTTSIRNGIAINALGDGMVDKKEKLIKSLEKEKLEIEKTTQAIQEYIDKLNVVPSQIKEIDNTTIAAQRLSNTISKMKSLSFSLTSLVSFKPGELDKKNIFDENVLEQMSEHLDGYEITFMEQLDRINSVLQNGLENLTISFAEGLGDLLSGDEDFSGFGKNVLEGIGQFIKQLGQALIVYGGLQKAFESWDLDPFSKIAIGIAAIAAGQTLINLAKKGPQIEEATGLAEGGVIGPGYSNDSFPAMLSSNEAVIPLDRYNFGGGTQDINITIAGEVKGEDIHYIVKEVERKQRNSF